MKSHGTPKHPRDLAAHACLGYAYLPAPDVWRFRNRKGEEVAVRADGSAARQQCRCADAGPARGPWACGPAGIMIRDELRTGSWSRVDDLFVAGESRCIWCRRPGALGPRGERW